MSAESKIRRAAEILSASSHAIALTGAGISTPSGIPDFRTPQSGLWEHQDPMQVASIQAFRRDPRVFYQWIRPLAETVARALPNPAHVALAELERLGLVKAVCTQNIDGLHQKAGSVHVLELHGSMRQAKCTRCGLCVSTAELWASAMERGEIPHCRQCQAVVKPDLVLYGEDLSQEVFWAAMAETKSCDVMLVVGSSLEVSPAADLPGMARRHGAQIVIVNREPTGMDSAAAIVIREDVAIALPKIVISVKQFKGMAY